VNDDGVMSRSEAARRVGVTAQTLARWARDGLVPHARDGRWTPAAVAQARIVSRLRERGHSLEEIRRAMESGRLAFGSFSQRLELTRDASGRRQNLGGQTARRAQGQANHHGNGLSARGHRERTRERQWCALRHCALEPDLVIFLGDRSQFPA